MLRSYRKTIWGIHVVNPEEEKERLRWEEFAEKEVFVFLSLTNPSAAAWNVRRRHHRHQLLLATQGRRWHFSEHAFRVGDSMESMRASAP